MKGAWLEELTWPEAEAWIDRGAPVVVPVGAVAKEHGHHLPLNTDFLVARELARRVAAALPVLIAPVVSFGYYPAFVRYPGSQHLEAETFGLLLRDILKKLVRDGARRIAIINTGVSTEPVLRLATRDLLEATGVRVFTADMSALGRKSRALLQQKLGGHGDEAETSCLLAIAPERVRMDRARVDYGPALDRPPTVFVAPGVLDPDPASGEGFSLTGVRGDPTLASAAKGEAILADMAGELVSGLETAFPEAFAR
ncbi:MAG: creatininase family protein [Alphaproteobacteria bacterium]|nr:creatininase family protein [Alphaproteobacteria bacterium]